MPQTIAPLSQTRPFTTLPRLPLTVEQFLRLVEKPLATQSKYELIHGDIVQEMSTARLHFKVQFAISRVLGLIYGPDFILSSFSLWISNHNLPAPDVAVAFRPVLEGPDDGYVLPREVRFVVEVSLTTLDYDATTKAVLYAQAGIGQYWIIDVAGRRLLIHEDATETGYNRVTEFSEEDIVTFPTVPGGAFAVRDILPPFGTQESV